MSTERHRKAYARAGEAKPLVPKCISSTLGENNA